jgi:hypothetical protein
MKEKSLKLDLSSHDKKFVKAAWFHENKIYILCVPNHVTILTKQFSRKFHIAKENVRIGTIEDLVREIIQHNTRVIISVRDGKVIYDPLKVIDSLKKNIQKGLMTGTKEGILRKFMLIKDHIKEIEKIKERIFDNLYVSTIEASQTALVLKGHIALIPRVISVKLKKELLNKGLERSDLNNAVEIISLYKLYEHKKINLPPGKKLDELSKKAELFREAVKKLK